LKTEKESLEKLKSNIVFFNNEKQMLGLKPLFVYSKSAIQCAIIPENEKVKSIANQLQEKGFDVNLFFHQPFHKVKSDCVFVCILTIQKNKFQKY
jgi:7-keto-8-aminopelargonate synthetase-like enzyme